MGYASYFEDIYLRTPDPSYRDRSYGRKHTQERFIPIETISPPLHLKDIKDEADYYAKRLERLQHKKEELDQTVISLAREQQQLQQHLNKLLSENNELRERLRQRSEGRQNLPEYDDTAYRACLGIIEAMSFFETHGELQAAVKIGEPLLETITKHIDEFGRHQQVYVDGLLQLGHLYFRIREYDKTNDCMINAINICRTIEYAEGGAMGHLYLGCSAFEQGRFPKSEENLIKAEEIGASVPHFDLYFGKLYYQKGQYEQALEYFEKVDVDKLPVVLYEIALIEYQRSNYKSALDSLKRFLRYEPHHAEARQLELVLVCRATHSSDIPYLNNHKYYLDLIEFFISDDRWDRVEEVIQRIEQKFNPGKWDSLADGAKFYYYRGRLSEQQRDIESAKSSFEYLYSQLYFLELPTEDIVWLKQFWERNGRIDERNSIAVPMLKHFIMKHPAAEQQIHPLLDN